MKFLWLILSLYTSVTFAKVTIVSETTKSTTYTIDAHSSFSISKRVSKAGYYRLIVKKPLEVSDIEGQFPYLMTVDNKRVDPLLDRNYANPKFDSKGFIIKDFRVSDTMNRIPSIEKDVEILIEGQTGAEGSTIILSKIFHVGAQIGSSTDGFLAKYGFRDDHANPPSIEYYLENVARIIHEPGEARVTIDKIQFYTGLHSVNFSPETYGYIKQEGSEVYLALLVPLGVEILDAQITDRFDNIVPLKHGIKVNSFPSGTVYTVLVQASTDYPDISFTLVLKTRLPENMTATFLSTAWYTCSDCGLWTNLQ